MTKQEREIQEALAPLIAKAETGEDWAEMCRLEAKMMECDVCGTMKPDLSKVIAAGIETMACDNCRSGGSR